MSTYRFFFLRACLPNRVILTSLSGSFLRVQFWNQVKITGTGFSSWGFFFLSYKKFPEIGCFVDTGSGAVIHV